MVLGMTPEQFWDGDPALVKAYRKADELRKERKNEELWLAGAYVYEALMHTIPITLTPFSKSKVDPGKYPDRPYPLSQQAAEKIEEERQKARFEKMLAMMEATSDANIKRQKMKEQGVNTSADQH